MKDYPENNEKWSWEELEYLEKVLGFHDKIFLKVFSKEREIRRSLPIEVIRKSLEADIFYPLLHKTFNHQNGTYNIKVLAKAFELLTEHYLSFSRLRLARVSFEAYEHSDHAGLEDRLVLRALKFCNKTMAPLKMKQMFRHMNKLVADRLMLYEFLDVVASADDISEVTRVVDIEETFSSQTDDGKLYEICNFKNVLTTVDDKCCEYLDRKFQESQKILPVRNVTSSTAESINIVDAPSEWITPPLVNSSRRTEMVARNGLQTQALEKSLESSNRKVCICSYGSPCVCSPRVYSTVEKQVYTKDEPVTPAVRQKERRLNERRYEEIVTKEDLEEMACKIQSIQWKMATYNGFSNTMKGFGISKKPSGISGPSSLPGS